MTRFCPECEARYEDDDLEHCPEDGTRLRVIVEDVDLEDDLIGRVLEGRWQIKERLGEGGMGTVFLGTQQTVDRNVAIKMLKPALSSTRDYAERFMREANVATSLNNPHCVTVYDFGQTFDGLLYLAMELMEGRTLADVLRDQKLNLRDILTVATQICSALAAAHDGNIVHRDLKPDNVFMVDVPGGGVFCKVLDFGIAKVIDSEEKTPVTQTGQIFGTPAYMSPEQCHSADVDQRSDLYSLGIILYELVSGRPPFHHGTPIKTLMAHINSDVEPPSQIGVPVPSRLEDIILRLLEKEPEDRYASALDVRSDLEALTRELNDEELDAVPAHSHAAETRTLELDSSPHEDEGTVEGVVPMSGEEAQDSGELLEAETAMYDGDEIDATETADRDVPRTGEVSSERGWSTGLVLTVAIGAAVAAAVVVLWVDARRDQGPGTTTQKALDLDVEADEETVMEPDEAQVLEQPVEQGGPDDDSNVDPMQPSIGRATDDKRTDDEQAGVGSEEAEDPQPAVQERDEPDETRESTGAESTAGRDDVEDKQPRRPTPDGEEDEAGTIFDNVLTSESANRVIKSHYPEVRRCYQEGLVEDADFGGAITVKLVVSDEGAVVNAKLVSSEVDHEGVETCVVTASKGWSFPKPADGQYKTLKHTFSIGAE